MLAIQSKNPKMLEIVLAFCEKLSQENLQTLFFKKNGAGHNCLMMAFFCGSEIQQQVLDLCKKLSLETLQILLLERNADGSNFLMFALSSSSSILEVQQQVLDFCERLSQKNLQTLLLQKSLDDGNCLMQAVQSEDLEILNFIMSLYCRVSPECLERAMEGFSQKKKDSVQTVKMQINQQSTKSACKT